MNNRNRTLAVVMAVATMLILAVVVVVFSLPAEGTGESGYDDNYIEECESYRNHSGYVGGYYDYAVFFEQGYEPIHVETYGEAIYLAPPDGVAWDRVYKCHREETTTSTTSTSTTIGEQTTTTTGETSTTTGGTTTTSSEGSSTTTFEDATTTTGSVTTTTVPTDPDTLPHTGVPYSGAGGIAGMILAASALVVGGYRLVKNRA